MEAAAAIADPGHRSFPGRELRDAAVPRRPAAADRDARSAVDLGAAARLRRRRGGGQRADRGAGPPRPRGDAVLRAGLRVERPGGRRCSDSPHPDEIERSLYEVDHVARAFEQIDARPRRARFDVIHDHCGFTALAMADRIDTPIVHTLHGQFTPSTAAFYARHGAQGGARRHQPRAARRRPRPGSAPLAAIPNPIDVGGLAAAGAARTTTCCGSAG